MLVQSSLRQSTPFKCIAKQHLVVVLTTLLLLLASCGKSSSKASAKPHFEKPGAGDVATLVEERVRQGDANNERVVVYVSATWCEPCVVFQDALKGGALDDELKGLVFFKFDYDEDGERLEKAGYDGRMIPRFVIPQKNGHASERRFEGSIKGPSAIDDIRPKLKKLLQPKNP